MKNDQIYTEDHSGYSMGKGLRVRMEVGETQLRGVGEIHMNDNGSLG